MELKLLFKNTSYLVITRIAKFFVGFIRTKLIAVYLGPVGTGIITQLMQITQSLSQITLLGINDGLVKEIAESNKYEIEFKKILAVLIKSYVSIILILLILTLILSFYFSRELTVYFFGDTKYYGYFLIGLASFPILIINSVSFAILKSYKQIKYIARSELVVIFINIFIFLVLIYVWGLTGAAISVTISLLTILIANHYYAKTKILNNLDLSLKDILKAKISQKSIKELLVFAGFGLTAGLAVIFTETITRSIIVTKLGINQIGIYSPVITWTSLFTGFVLPSIGTYLYPRFSESKSDFEVNGILNDSLRFVTLLMIPFLLLCIPIRFQLITIFYSDQFFSAGRYITWHFLGTLFYLWMYTLSMAMTPTGRIKIYGVSVVIMCFVDFCVVFYFVPKIGLYGWMLKFLISPIIFFIFYIIYFNKAIQFKLEKKNTLIMSYALFSFILLVILEKYLISNYKVNFTIGAFLTGLSYFLLSKSEKNFIINYYHNIRSR